MKEMKKTKKLNKNSNVAKNSIQAYACPCACDAGYPCASSAQTYGMKVHTIGGATHG